MARLRLRPRRLDPRLRVRQPLLTLCQVLNLLLPLLRLGGPLVVGQLQLLDLQVDHLLALGDPRLERCEPLVLFERHVEFGQALGDLALPLLELSLGGGKRGSTPVERRRLPRDVLLEANLAARDLDLLVRPEEEAALSHCWERGGG